MLGGPVNTDPGALTIRWYGTSNYELNFCDRVVLLDTFYDRARACESSVSGRMKSNEPTPC